MLCDVARRMSVLSEEVGFYLKKKDKRKRGEGGVDILPLQHNILPELHFDWLTPVWLVWLPLSTQHNFFFYCTRNYVFEHPAFCLLHLQPPNHTPTHNKLTHNYYLILQFTQSLGVWMECFLFQFLFRFIDKKFCSCSAPEWKKKKKRMVRNST